MDRTGFSSTRATAPLVISCDVGMESIHIVCPALGESAFPRVYAVENYTEPLRRELLARVINVRETHDVQMSGRQL